MMVMMITPTHIHERLVIIPHWPSICAYKQKSTNENKNNGHNSPQTTPNSKSINPHLRRNRPCLHQNANNRINLGTTPLSSPSTMIRHRYLTIMMQHLLPIKVGSNRPPPPITMI